MKRDTQRGRLYKAERTTAAAHVRPYATMVELWTYLERIQRDRWFRRHYGVWVFRVHDGRGRRRGAADSSGWITLPRFARYPLYILHEVAHCVSPRGCKHDHQYAANYLKLVRHFLGAAAHAELRAAFKEHRVRYTPPRQLSPETLERLRASLRDMRAAGPVLTIPPCVDKIYV
jgi:hypothetical protein